MLMPGQDDLLEMSLVSSVMSTEPVSFTQDTVVSDIAREMAQKQISCAVIVDNGRPIGIITERDLIRKVITEGNDPGSIAISDIMTKSVLTLESDARLVTAGELMRKNRVRRFPIVRNGRLVGVVTETDVIRGLIRLIKRLNAKLIADEISLEGFKNKLRDILIHLEEY